MLEMHLKHPEFTHSACGSFTKNKKRIQKFKETRDSRYIYQNELDNDCFQQVTYGDFKDLTKRTFIFLKIPNILNINVYLLQWIMNFP